MRMLLGFLLIVSAQAVTITGTFKYPDGTVLNGYVVVKVSRSPAKNTCSSSQVIGSQTIAIVNGTLGTLSLPATSCLTPSAPYQVTVTDMTNVTVYRESWTVPAVSSVDVTELTAGYVVRWTLLTSIDWGALTPDRWVRLVR